MKVQAPGTILQLLYLKERLATLKPGRFLEVGCGRGHISSALLQKGWSGTGIDLSRASIQENLELNRAWIQNGCYQTYQANFLDPAQLAGETFDLIISSMVLEHLDMADEARFLDRCRTLVAPNGLMIMLVPASMSYWGIEDEIAGHYRRYDRSRIKALAQKNGWACQHLAGLTCPLSNLLLPISNRLVSRSEKHKRSLNKAEQTVLSGNRHVGFKTSFPAIIGLLLNQITMMPWHWLQKLCRDSDRCMILYAELGLSSNHRPVDQSQ